MRLPSQPLCALFALTLFIPVAATGQTDCGWNPDYNGDNTIGVADLLGLLGVFEEADSDGDGIFDSQDDCVGVYDECGVCNGSGVDSDADGLCDDVDDCIGAYDECGVCNGPGPNIPVIDEVIYATDSVYLEPLNSWYTFEYAVDTVFTYVCPVSGCMDETAGNYNPEAVIADDSCTYGPEQCGGSTTVTYDGYTYDLVAIGEQCWFKENLRTAVYSNGDAIPGELSNSEWSGTTSGAQAIYSNSAANFDAYGRLYNWYAVYDARGLCPTGWHVPSDEEWTELTEYLGGEDVAGTQMKSSSSDAPPWNGSNSSGFSGLPGGYRSYSGNFYAAGNYGSWWSSSPYNGGAWNRALESNYDLVSRNDASQRGGFSVRCVRD